jgi:hypothetical protein
MLYNQMDDALYDVLNKLIISYLVFDKIQFSISYSCCEYIHNIDIMIMDNNNVFRFGYNCYSKIL